MKREKNPYSAERDFEEISITPELRQMIDSWTEPDEGESPWAPGTSPREDASPVQHARKVIKNVVENPEEYDWDNWDQEMKRDLEEFIKFIHDNPDDPKDVELGGIFISAGFIDLRKDFPHLYKSTKLRRQLGLDPKFEGSEDATNPGFGPRQESVEKLTPDILRQMVREAIAEATGDGEYQKVAKNSFKRMVKMVSTGGTTSSPPYTKKPKVGKSGPAGMP